MVPATELLTYEAYLPLPETNRRYDVLDGKLVMSRAPTPIRQRIVIKLSLKLTPFVQEHRLGEVFYSPVDVLINRKALRTRQPDAMLIHADRGEGIRENLTEGVPDLVNRNPSPSTNRAQVEAELVDDAATGVNRCWLVSPEAQTIEGLHRTTGAWTGQEDYGRGEAVTSRLLPGFSLNVNELFD